MAALVCPRCDKYQTEKVADSPIKGKWEVYRCKECRFVWRSSEDLTGLDKRIEYLRKTAVHFWD